MPVSVPRGAMIRAGFRLLGLYGPARDYFAQMRYKPKPKFAAGLIRPVLSGPGAAAIGRMIPQPIVATLDRQQILFDNCLPDRPVVLVFAEMPEQWVNDGMLERLRSLGSDVIGLTPEWMNPIAAAFPIVRDQSRFFSEKPFRECLGHALLLRRDRYVAAIQPVESLAEMIPMIEHLTAALGSCEMEPFAAEEERQAKAVWKLRREGNRTKRNFIRGGHSHCRFRPWRSRAAATHSLGISAREDFYPRPVLPMPSPESLVFLRTRRHSGNRAVATLGNNASQRDPDASWRSGRPLLQFYLTLHSLNAT